MTLRPFGALVHIDWLEMKSGSKAHGIAARALLITDPGTEFLGVLPSKRKLASEVICALHDFDDPGSPAIRRLISDRAPEFLSAGRTLRSSERTNRTAVEFTRASLLQAGFQDSWWAVCMIYFVAMWNGHMRGRDGFTPYQRGHGKDAPYRMYPWRSLVFAHLHNPVVGELQVALEADSLHFGRSVTTGPAGIWGRCYDGVPLFRFTCLNRPSVVHVRRCNDNDFPEIVSYPLRQRLMVQGDVADRTLPVPGVATEEDGWALGRARRHPG